MGKPLFYLSFCDGDKPEGSRWLGACYVSAADGIEAVKEAHRLGCNPGGQVLFVQVPDGVQVRKDRMNRLLTRSQVEEATGDEPGSSVTSGELMGENPDALASVNVLCQKCHKDDCSH